MIEDTHGLTVHDLEVLIPLLRHEQASHLLEGKLGPLTALPFTPEVAALAYLIHLARRGARRPGQILAGRPGWEADETLRNRVLSVSESVGSLREFGHELFERLNLSLSGLQAHDAMWWLGARQAFADRWEHLTEDLILTEACTAARLLDNWLYAVHAAAKGATA